MDLRKLQLVQLEILQIIDEFCKKYNLRYSLYAGTMLGAVRHKGFIPWDDDLDICMPRADYNKLIELWPKESIKGYIIQNKENSLAFTQSFTKVRKVHTTFLQEEWERGKYHTGIFVDIFPVDRMPAGKWDKACFKWNCMLYQLYTREFVPPKGNVLVRMISAFILKATLPTQRVHLRECLLHQITKYNDQRQLETVLIETLASLQITYPADMLDQYVQIEFEGHEFMCFEDWDEHLKRKFGNYMKLPPESERTWKHHPLILDFERDVDELEERA